MLSGKKARIYRACDCQVAAHATTGSEMLTIKRHTVEASFRKMPFIVFYTFELSCLLMAVKVVWRWWWWRGRKEGRKGGCGEIQWSLVRKDALGT